jgi:hypothetical protein
MVNANMLRHIQENAVQRIAVCHETDGIKFEYLLQILNTHGLSI